MDTPNLSAILLIVSPDRTVYVNGVGLGRGVSAVTKPSGVCVVPAGESRLSVEVTYGIKSTVEGTD